MKMSENLTYADSNEVSDEEVISIYEKYYKLDLVITLLKGSPLLELDNQLSIENLIYRLCNNSTLNKYLIYRRNNENRMSYSDFLGIETDVAGIDKLLVVKVNRNDTGIQVGDIIVKINGRDALSQFVDEEKYFLSLYRLENNKYVEKEICYLNPFYKKNVPFSKENLFNYQKNYYLLNSFSNLSMLCNFLDSLYDRTYLTLDLRFNMGGDINDAKKFLELLIPGDTELFFFENELIRTAQGSQKVYEFECINLLVSEMTASSAEIVCYALQEHLVTHVIGDSNHTYGKGVVQSCSEFDDGSIISIPVARVFTIDKQPLGKNTLRIDELLSSSQIDEKFCI